MRFFMLRLLTIIGIIVMLFSCSKEEFPGFSEEVQKKFEDALDKAMMENHIPGVVVGVWVGDEGWVKAKGTANLATNEPMSEENHFRIGSVTKTFTGTVVLQLVDSGLISLDQTLEHYLPEYPFPQAGRITVRHLGSMRSGIFNYSDDSAFFANAKACNWDFTATPDYVVRIGLDHPLLFNPGEGYLYSNTNTVLLGLICEKVTGKPFGQLMSEMILTPNGLDDTFWPETRFLPEPFSHGYTRQTSDGQMKDATFFNPSWVGAAGMMVSNIHDLKKWIRLVGTGALNSAAMQAERMNIQDNYGFGIQGADGWIFHFGAIQGFTTAAFYHSGMDATFVIHVNSNIDNPFTGNSPAEAVGQVFMELVTESFGQ
jgi:D-alanyl-D-alanine carboxypeptidase